MLTLSVTKFDRVDGEGTLFSQLQLVNADFVFVLLPCINLALAQ